MSRYIRPMGTKETDLQVLVGLMGRKVQVHCPGPRQGDVGTIVGVEDTLLGPMIKVSFDAAGSGLFKPSALRPLPAAGKGGEE